MSELSEKSIQILELPQVLTMLAGCAAMLCGSGSVTLTGGEQVAKSYPDFWKDMESLGGRMEVLEP